MKPSGPSVVGLKDADGLPIDATNPLTVEVLTDGSPVAEANPLAVEVEVSGAAATAANPLGVAVSVAGAAVADANPLPVEQQGNTSVVIADGPNLDAFSRLRVGLPQLRLSALFDTDKRPLVWDERLVNGGLATHLPFEDSVEMTVEAASSESCRQTKEYYVYRAAQSQLVLCTFAMATPQAGVTQEVGYFDDNNGLFFRASGATLQMVRRTDTSGTPVDAPVDQADWNLDKLDGSGASGITLDVAKTQILVIDFQWLGVGRVRFGFDIDGLIVYCHELRNANNLTAVYMRTPKLPVRYRIANGAGLLPDPVSMKQICSAVVREGGTDEPGVQRSIDNGNAAATVGTNWTGILGLRLKASNIRATLRMVAAAVLNEDTSDPVQYAVLLNPDGTGAAVWSDIVQDGSIAQKSRTVTAITVDGSGDPTTGCVLPLVGYAAAANGGRGGVLATEVEEILPIVADIAGTPDEAWLCFRTTSATSPVRGTLSYEEVR